MRMFFLLMSLLTVSVSCGKRDSGSSPSTEIVNPLRNVELETPSGEMIHASLAYTSADQMQGLQYVKDSEFSYDQGKLFFYLKDSARTFWMPNTFFNLDIFYLDQNMVISDVVWNLPAYAGTVSSEIPRAPRITSRHVLEMKAGSEISSKLKVGDKLQWKSSLTLDQTETAIQNELNP